MRIAAINGSPRMKWNTDMMLNAFISGIIKSEPEAEIIKIDLYRYKYSGCRECFLCKMNDDRFFGKCNFKDEITPVNSWKELMELYLLPLFSMMISAVR